MKIGYGLTSVLYGCTVMTYAACQQRAESRTTQPRTCLAPAPRSFAGCGRTTRSGLRHLSASSLPLSSTGPTTEGKGKGERSEACLYRQTPTQPDSTRAVIRICQEVAHQRRGQQGSRRTAAARARSWLSALQPSATFNSSIVSIVCCRRNWRWLTGCWSPTDDRRLHKLEPTRR